MSKTPLFNSKLAKAIPGFTPRVEQEAMAQAVKKAIQTETHLVVEAGTGTGKTFGYLIPALNMDKKVVISTGSKNLQDQLFLKDLPLIKKALSFKGSVALLKGRRNYLCLERLKRSLSVGNQLTSQAVQAEMSHIRRWSSQTQTGDISQCTKVSEQSEVWPHVTSTNDNCLGSDCPEYDDCFVVKARRAAMDAQVVVVNHHLFLADVIVKNSNFGELIPDAEVTIFDEAHQLPDIACHYFGEQISSKQLFDLAKDTLTLYLSEMKDLAQLKTCAESLQKAVQDFRLFLFENNRLHGRGDLRHLWSNAEALTAFERIISALCFCEEVFILGKGQSKAIDKSIERVADYVTIMKRLLVTDVQGFSYWYEAQNSYFNLALTPLSVDDQFSKLMTKRQGSWIFTSATLSVNNKLSYFTRRLGLYDTEELILESPFDYEHQALLCVPRYLPDPNAKEYAARLVESLAPVIEANQGRCFFLCTSFAMVRSLAEGFRQVLSLPILVQGEQGKGELLQSYLELGNALLIATSSFWEGIDVRGDLLSCVIIDKIPFTSPEEPLMKARMEDYKRQNFDSFHLLQIPEAVITLKQGVGRLIRHHDDRGVMILCDNRLVNKNYASIFLNSLPPAPRTRNLDRVIQFLTSSKESISE